MLALKDEVQMVEIVAEMPTVHSKATYFPVLNTLRGVAALAVVLFHFLTMPNLVEAGAIRSLAGYGALGVHVFFVISGIVIPLSLVSCQYSYRKLGRFLWKRALRIEPPYLISVVLFALYGLARTWLGELNPTLGRGTYPVPDIATTLAHIGYLVPFKSVLPYFKDATWLNGAYWTLAVEFQYYLLVALTFPLLFNRRAYIRVFIILLMIFSSTILYETKQGSHSGLVFRWLPYFVVGIQFVLYRLRMCQRAEYLSLTGLALATVVFNDDVAHACAAISVILFVSYMPHFRSKLGDYFGDISYSLYLLHGLLAWSFLNFVAGSGCPGWIRVISLLVAVVISIVSAHLMWRWVEASSRRASKSVRLTIVS